MPNIEEYETTQEAANRLGLTSPTVRRYVEGGILPGAVIGRLVGVVPGAVPDESKLPPRGSHAHIKNRQAEIADVLDEIS